MCSDYFFEKDGFRLRNMVTGIKSKVCCSQYCLDKLRENKVQGTLIREKLSGYFFEERNCSPDNIIQVVKPCLELFLQGFIDDFMKVRTLQGQKDTLVPLHGIFLLFRDKLCTYYQKDVESEINPVPNNVLNSEDMGLREKIRTIELLYIYIRDHTPILKGFIERNEINEALFKLVLEFEYHLRVAGCLLSKHTGLISTKSLYPMNIVYRMLDIKYIDDSASHFGAVSRMEKDVFEEIRDGSRSSKTPYMINEIISRIEKFYLRLFSATGIGVPLKYEKPAREIIFDFEFFSTQMDDIGSHSRWFSRDLEKLYHLKDVGTMQSAMDTEKIMKYMESRIFVLQRACFYLLHNDHTSPEIFKSTKPYSGATENNYDIEILNLENQLTVAKADYIKFGIHKEAILECSDAIDFIYHSVVVSVVFICSLTINSLLFDNSLTTGILWILILGSLIYLNFKGYKLGLAKTKEYPAILRMIVSTLEPIELIKRKYSDSDFINKIKENKKKIFLSLESKKQNLLVIKEWSANPSFEFESSLGELDHEINQRKIKVNTVDSGIYSTRLFLIVPSILSICLILFVQSTSFVMSGIGSYFNNSSQESSEVKKRDSLVKTESESPKATSQKTETSQSTVKKSTNTSQKTKVESPKKENIVQTSQPDTSVKPPKEEVESPKKENVVQASQPDTSVKSLEVEEVSPPKEKAVRNKFVVARNFLPRNIGTPYKNIKGIRSSSELKEKKVTHSADRLFDTSNSTAWCEGVSSKGVGESVEFEVYCSKDTVFTGFAAITGYAKKQSIFEKNGRIKKAKVEIRLNDDVRWDGTIKFKDIMKEQWAPLGDITCAANSTMSVRFVIGSVYSGTKYKDTCMSQLFLYKK